MGLEQLEQKNNGLSGIEREKAAELSGKIERIYDFVNRSNDSNVAEEMKGDMEVLIEALQEDGSRVSDFYLWNLFILHGAAENIADWKRFDTPDGAVEKFIEGLEKLTIEHRQ